MLYQKTNNKGDKMSDLFISKTDFDKIKELSSTIDTITLTIGSLEVQKQQLVSHHMGVRTDLERQAKDCLIRAGIPEDKLENYRISLEDGKIQEVPTNKP